MAFLEHAKFSPRYVAAMTAYGAVRKAVRVWDAKVYDFDSEKPCERAPMLVTNKALLVAFGGLSAIYAWPMYAYWDACSIEKRIKGIKEKEPVHSLEYIIC